MRTIEDILNDHLLKGGATGNVKGNLTTCRDEVTVSPMYIERAMREFGKQCFEEGFMKGYNALKEEHEYLYNETIEEAIDKLYVKYNNGADKHTAEWLDGANEMIKD